jgi:hypothetical protein
LPEGECRICYKNGDTYKGLYKHGVRHGLGVYTYRSGHIISGSYDNDMPCLSFSI